MKILLSDLLRNIEAKVRKGDIRNTVLRQIKNLNRSLNLLSQGITIKEKEMIEHKKRPEKVNKLKKQVSIMNNGLRHIQRAVKKLEKYKDTKI